MGCVVLWNDKGVEGMGEWRVVAWCGVVLCKKCCLDMILSGLEK